jgi:hypothetical protein
MTTTDLADDLAQLERLFDDALERVLPNPVALRFTDLRLGYQGKRDLVFGLGLLDEGENEAALIAGLAHTASGRDPAADLTHLLREAWYYLRTSIDPQWQFDETPPSFGPALRYIGALLQQRVAAHIAPPALSSDAPDAITRRALLAALRSS